MLPKSAIAIIVSVILVTLCLSDIGLIYLFGIGWFQLIAMNLFVLGSLSIRMYFRIKKGDKMYAQPSHKYMIKYVYFPLGLAIYLPILLMLKIPAIITGVLI